MFKFLYVLILSVVAIAGCAAGADRVAEKYCAIPVESRKVVRYAIENDLICTGSVLVPSIEVQLFIRAYCATNYTRPAIKSLVEKDICNQEDESR